jgi:hypothetical protein
MLKSRYMRLFSFGAVGLHAFWHASIHIVDFFLLGLFIGNINQTQRAFNQQKIDQ